MIHFIFPIHCSLCHARIRSKGSLCDSCIDTLPYQPDPLFFKEGILCFAPFFYEGPIQWMLKQLKFGQQLPYTHLLASLMLDSIQTHSVQQPHLLIPVPLHKKRLQERGFNQSVEIAKYLSRHLHIPLERRRFIRHRATKPQAQCTALERSNNIQHAFTLKKALTHQGHIALLDDIITTGHTIMACYRALAIAPVSQIDCWAIAKTL